MSFTLHALRTFTSQLNFMLSSTCVRICYPYLFPTMIRRNVEMFTECSSLFRGDPWLLTYDVRTDCCLVVVGILHYFIREWLGLWVDNSAMRHECDVLDIELCHLCHLSKRTFSWWGWRERDLETWRQSETKMLKMSLFIFSLVNQRLLQAENTSQIDFSHLLKCKIILVNDVAVDRGKAN